MRNPSLARHADRWLSRIFPTRFAPGPAEWRHARAGAPHLWRMQRQFQIDFLQRMGLSAGDHLLDLGCGTLRGGLPLIGYLAAGNYAGIDIRADVIEEARRELAEAALEERYPRLLHVEGLSDLDLRRRYDFVWAFSVLLHLEDDALSEALAFVARHLEPRGVGYANVHLGDGRLGSWNDFPILARPLDFYVARAREVGLIAESLGRLRELGHLSGDRTSDAQFMLRFRVAS